MDERNGESLCIVKLVLILDRDVCRWPGSLTKISVKEIFVSF